LHYIKILLSKDSKFGGTAQRNKKAGSRSSKPLTQRNLNIFEILMLTLSDNMATVNTLPKAKFEKIFGKETVSKVSEDYKRNISFFVYPVYGEKLVGQLKKLEPDYNIISIEAHDQGLVLKIILSPVDKKEVSKSMLRIAEAVERTQV
jgi:hypothetical protein